MTEAAISLGLTSAQRRNIEQACRAVEIRPTKSMTLRDGTGASVAKFTDGGDLILIGGDLLTSQSITASPTTSEFIIRDSSNNLFALINLSTGDCKLSGKVYEIVTGTLSPPTYSFIVKQDDTVVSFLTTTDWVNATIEPNSPYMVPAGSLILAGHVVNVDVE